VSSFFGRAKVKHSGRPVSAANPYKDDVTISRRKNPLTRLIYHEHQQLKLL
jgi:hypothetical protein